VIDIGECREGTVGGDDDLGVDGLERNGSRFVSSKSRELGSLSLDVGSARCDQATPLFRSTLAVEPGVDDILSTLYPMSEPDMLTSYR
jgi:hypothetical protein